LASPNFQVENNVRVSLISNNLMSLRKIDPEKYSEPTMHSSI